MGPNPVLNKLGYGENDRLVIIHTDDIGMCQASVNAFEDLWEFGLISSGATMVPCSWFPEAAKLCRNNTEIDLGVHLTLTSEWDSYRWGPISTRDPISGMMDKEGYFHRSSEDAQKYGDPGAVELEITAQVERALSAGIDITHADTHMGTVGSIKFIPSYLSLVTKYHLPVMILRLDKEGWIKMGFDPQTAEMAYHMVSQLEEQGLPMVDHLLGLELDKAKSLDERIDYAKSVFKELQSGITHFIIHPSKDTPELRAITPDWECRVADYYAFMNDSLKNFIKEIGIEVVGYREIKALIL